MSIATRPRGPRPGPSLVGALLLAQALALATPTIGCRGARAVELPSYGAVPEVALIDQRGTAMSTADLHGGVTIVNFIFTRCTTICPVTSLKMQRLAAATADQDAIELLSITVDPEFDKPEVLAAFAARYQADPTRWRFATGDPAAVKSAIEDGFKVAVERRGEVAEGIPDIVHGGHFILIDQALGIRGYYDSNDPARLAALQADARALAAAPAPGS